MYISEGTPSRVAVHSQQAHNFETASIQRQDVESTLFQRYVPTGFIQYHHKNRTYTRREREREKERERERDGTRSLVATELLVYSCKQVIR